MTRQLGYISTRSRMSISPETPRTQLHNPGSRIQTDTVSLTHHRLQQRHPDLLVLDVGGIQTDGHFDLVKHVEGVLILHSQGGALERKTTR